MKTNATKDCEGCGELISIARLAAMPKTKVCIGCQQEDEKTGRYALHRMDVKVKEHCGEIESMENVLHRGTG